MKFGHGPWAYNEFLAPLNMLKFRISSPCAKENRVFGFTAPPLHRRFGEPMARNSTIGLFPVSPERDLSEKWLEGISSSLHHRQSILNVPKIEVWKKSCAEGIKAMIVDPFVFTGTSFPELSTFYCRFHCRPLNHFGLSVSNQTRNCGVCVWNANLHHHSRPATGTLNTTTGCCLEPGWPIAQQVSRSLPCRHALPISGASCLSSKGLMPEPAIARNVDVEGRHFQPCAHLGRTSLQNMIVA